MDRVDEPIESDQDDELSRGPFASLVATALLAENKERATILGLVGAWGTGKSSVANLVVRQIESHVQIVRFEPWMVGSTEALAREFFRELGKAALPRKDTKEAREDRTRYYKYVAQALDALSMTAESLHTLDVPFTGIAGKALKGGQKAIEVAAKGLESQSNQPTLREAKESISKALKNLSKPIVVVIDDIDRLNKDEVRTVFQIIKACADFPNVRYLLLYDRAQVVHALGDSVHDPSAFLEKIIGQAFDLPEATKAQRERLLSNHLESLGLTDLAGKPLERLQLLFSGVLLPGLPTVRHIKRFVSTVASLLPGVVAEGHRNIDPADFLALEFIRQYVPELYSVLRDEEAPKPGGFLAELVDERSLTEQRRARREAALAAAGPMQALATEALSVLEKNVEVSSGIRRSWSLTMHNERRFFSEHWRGAYLGFDFGRAALSEQDWEALRSSLRDSDSGEWTVALNDPERRRAIARLIADRGGLAKQESKQLLKDVLRWAEERPSEFSDDLFPSTVDPMQAVYLIGTSCLVTLAKGEEAIDAFKEAMGATQAVVAPAYLLGMEIEGMRHGGRGDWSSRQAVEPLAADLATKLKVGIDDGALWSSPSPDEYLRAWTWLAGQEEYSRWFHELSQDPLKVAEYVNKIMGPRRRQEGFTGWGGSLNEPFYKAVESMDEGLLTEDGRWARSYYLVTMRRNARHFSGSEPEED